MRAHRPAKGSRTRSAPWLAGTTLIGTVLLAPTLGFAQDAAAVPAGETLAEISAEGGGDPAQQGYQPVRTNSATLSDQALIDVPQAVNVVTQQVLQDQRVRTLDEALYNVSGVTQANTLGGTQDAFIRRGFGDNRDGSVLRDGLRTALPRTFDQTAERVEVLKGPASALYGIIDPGGLVNVVTKAPSFTRFGSVQLTGTTFKGAGATVDLTGPIGDTGFAYPLIADHFDEQYWRNFGNNQTQVFAPSIAWRGDTTTARLSYEYSRYKVPFDRGTIFDPATGKAVRTPREWRFDEPYNISTGETHVLQTQITQELGDHWKASLDYAFSHNWYNDNQARVLSYNSVTRAVTRRTDATQDSVFDVHAARINAVGKYDIFGLPNEFVVGGTYDQSDVLRTRLIRGPNSSAFNIYAPVYGRLGKSFTVSNPDSDQQEHLKNGSFYAQDSITIMDRLILVGGVSYENYSDWAGKGRPFNLNTDVAGDATIPRVGLVYKLTPSISLYSVYSESFKPNSSIASAVGALPPERGVSYEGGVKVEVADGITATAAYYDITKENVQYSEVDNGITVTKTAGKVGSRGIEIDMAGRILPDWSVVGSFAYTNAIVLDDPVLAGKRLPQVAKYTASGFLTHDFGEVWGGHLRAGLGGRYQSERAGDAANTFMLPAYAVADAFVSYETQVQGYATTVQLNVKNIFDTTYYTSSIGTNLGVEYGEPLKAVLTARVDF